MVIRLETEPSVISVGSRHVAAALNNKAWFYCLTGENRGFLLRTIEYVGIIRDLRMNEFHASALFTDGRINLHDIESSADNDGSPSYGTKNSTLRNGGHYLDEYSENEDNFVPNRESKMIEDQKGKICCLQMTQDLLVYGSDSGNVEFFSFEDWAIVNLYRHQLGIKAIETDFQGLRVAFIDIHEKMFIYDAVTDSVMDVSLDDFPLFPTRILWDKTSLDSNLIILHDDTGSVHIHTFVRESIRGPLIEFIESFSIPATHLPRLVSDGMVVCQTSWGKRADILLPTHEIDQPRKKNKDSLEQSFKKLRLMLKMRRYRDALDLCSVVQSSKLSSSVTLRDTDKSNTVESVWTLLGNSALFDVNLDLAECAFSKIPDYGMLYYIKSLKEIEEKALLAGHLALCLQEFDLAQELFLSSSQPKEALFMRQNIQDWETALILAKRLSPETIAIISREHATQLEVSSDYEGALIHFERALINRALLESPSSSASSYSRTQIPSEYYEDQKEHLPFQRVLEKAFDGSRRELERHEQLCMAGIARNAMRSGNCHRGLSFVSHLKHDKELQLECARILESQRQFSDAAALFESGGDVDKACSLYLQMKNVSKISPFIDKITSTEMLLEYAKLQEEEHRFLEAVKAYKRAGKDEDVVRLLLEKLKNPGEAIRIVRENKSPAGAKMVAKFFQSINDIPSAIAFLIMSNCTEEAFQLASSTNQMDVLSNVMQSSNSKEDTVFFPF
jgi:WD repeat-containing protein 19